MQLRRLVIAEAVTFPALGRAIYELRPGRTIAKLALAFEQLDDRELLKVADPTRAASDFNRLVMSDPLNHAMLLGDNQPPKRESIDNWADQAGATFRAHTPPSTATRPDPAR